MTNRILVMKRRDLTPEEQEDAARLRQWWEATKGDDVGMTQEWLGKETGLGSQGLMGQYLRGFIPLNLPALLAFCRVFEVRPEEISPRLAAELARWISPADDWPFAIERRRYDRLPAIEKERIDQFIENTVTIWERANKKQRQAG